MDINPRILQQFNTEIESWRRTLSFMRAENVHLKTRISEIASDVMSNDLLEEAEKFQDKFIQMDEMISLSLPEITSFQHRVRTEYLTDGSLRTLFKAQQGLRNNIETLEQKFNKLKFQFNLYLTEKL